MAKYHINPTTGDPGICKATKNCPFGHLEDDHYASKAEATKAFEASMQKNNLSSQTKPGQPETYEFPSYKLAYAENAVAKANRRAERAGISERIAYNIEKYDITSTDPATGLINIEERVRFTLNRPALKHEGWTFAGTISWDEEAGMISRLVPGEKLIERPRLRECDVCKTTRHRQDTYVVQKDGEQVQVGSNCLKQFMGIKPAGLWMLDYDLDVNEKPEETFNSTRGRGYDARKDSKQILGLALALVETYGWTSRSNSYGDKPATVDRLHEVLLNNAQTAEIRREHARIIARGEKLAKEAEALLASARKFEGDTEYAINMRNIAKEDTVSYRNMGLLISVIASQNNKEAKAVREQEKKMSNWVGNVGEKITPARVKVEDIKYISNNFGYHGSSSQLVTMKDQMGNVYKTFYAGSASLAKGKEYVLTSGTIKNHEEWQGEKQTLITRIKFEQTRPDKFPATELPKKSLFREAWTTDENDKIANETLKNLAKNFKKQAGREGWDKRWDEPLAPELKIKYNEEKRKINTEYTQRHQELTRENNA